MSLLEQDQHLFLSTQAGETRKDWHKKVYVKLLADDFPVITLEARGSWESDPADEAISFYFQKLHFTLVEDSYQPGQDKRWVVVSPPGSTSHIPVIGQK